MLIVAVIAHIRLVAAILVRIILRAHIAAAAPVLVADAEVVQLPWLLAAVLCAQIGHRRFAVEGHILDPLRHLLHGAAADVAADVRLAAEQLAQHA